MRFLIKRYGHPSEIIVEVARELKQSKAQRDEEAKRQAQNQKRNERIRTEIAQIKFGGNEHLVKYDDIRTRYKMQRVRKQLEKISVTMRDNTEQ